MKKENIVGIKSNLDSKVMPLDKQNIIILNPLYVEDTLKKVFNLQFGPINYYEGFANGYLVYRKDISYPEAYFGDVWGILSKDGDSHDLKIKRISKLGIPTEGMFPFRKEVPFDYLDFNAGQEAAKYGSNGFFDASGNKITTHSQIRNLERFNNGLAPIKIENYENYNLNQLFYHRYIGEFYWVYINTKGEIVSDRFDMASKFVDGYALVQKCGRCFFIDTNMQYVRDYDSYKDRYFTFPDATKSWEKRENDIFGNKSYKYEKDDIDVNYQNGYIKPIDIKTGIPILFIPLLKKILKEFDVSLDIDDMKDFKSFWQECTKIIANQGVFALNLENFQIIQVSIFKGEREYDEYGGSIISFQDSPITRIRKKD